MKQNDRINEVYADVPALYTTANSLGENAGSYEATLKKLETCFAEMKTFWKGDAADAFFEQITADFQSLRAIGAALKKLESDYRFAAKEYAANEERSGEIIKAVYDV